MVQWTRHWTLNFEVHVWGLNLLAAAVHEQGTVSSLERTLVASSQAASFLSGQKKLN